MQLFYLQRRFHVQIFTYEDVSVCILSPNFPTFWLDHRVSTQMLRPATWSCASSHTKRCVSTHFLIYKDVSEYTLTPNSPLLRLVRRNYGACSP